MQCFYLFIEILLKCDCSILSYSFFQLLQSIDCRPIPQFAHLLLNDCFLFFFRGMYFLNDWVRLNSDMLFQSFPLLLFFELKLCYTWFQHSHFFLKTNTFVCKGYFLIASFIVFSSEDSQSISEIEVFSRLDVHFSIFSNYKQNGIKMYHLLILFS